MPCSPACSFVNSKCSELVSRAFDGMHPTFTHVPPSVWSRSTQTVSRPSCAARRAATYPPGPPPMMTTSVNEHARGVLDQLLDPDQEEHGLLAVDEAMIVRERDVHHRADHDLTVERDRAVLDFVQSENAGLRVVEDRRRDEGAEDSAVRDREGSTCQVIQRELPISRARGHRGDLATDLNDPLGVRVFNNRYHQAL